MKETHQSWKKSQSGFKRIFNATGYSLSGFRYAFLGEAAFRQLLAMNVILIPLAFTIDCTPYERALLIGVMLISLIVELLNSAIEAVVDRISLDCNELSKQAKDMGSAAQFLALILIISTWVIIVWRW